MDFKDVQIGQEVVTASYHLAKVTAKDPGTGMIELEYVGNSGHKFMAYPHAVKLPSSPTPSNQAAALPKFKAGDPVTIMKGHHTGVTGKVVRQIGFTPGHHFFEVQLDGSPYLLGFYDHELQLISRASVTVSSVSLPANVYVDPNAMAGLGAWAPMNNSTVAAMGYGPDETKCQCGTDKTMGAEAGEFSHSDWCPKYKKNPYGGGL